MSAIIGLDAKLYYCAAGIGETPTWVLIPKVRTVGVALSDGEADASSRAAAGWKQILTTLREGSIEVEAVWDPDDATLEAVRAAYWNRSLLGIAVTASDGDVATDPSFQADCKITALAFDQPLEDAMTVKFTAKPTVSVNLPKWNVPA